MGPDQSLPPVQSGIPSGSNIEPMGSPGSMTRPNWPGSYQPGSLTKPYQPYQSYSSGYPSGSSYSSYPSSGSSNWGNGGWSTGGSGFYPGGSTGGGWTTLPGTITGGSAPINSAPLYSPCSSSSRCGGFSYGTMIGSLMPSCGSSSVSYPRAMGSFARNWGSNAQYTRPAPIMSSGMSTGMSSGISSVPVSSSSS